MEDSSRFSSSGIIYSNYLYTYFFICREFLWYKEPNYFFGSHLFRARPFPAGSTRHRGARVHVDFLRHINFNISSFSDDIFWYESESPGRFFVERNWIRHFQRLCRSDISRNSDETVFCTAFVNRVVLAINLCIGPYLPLTCWFSRRGVLSAFDNKVNCLRGFFALIASSSEDIDYLNHVIFHNSSFPSHNWIVYWLDDHCCPYFTDINVRGHGHSNLSIIRDGVDDVKGHTMPCLFSNSRVKRRNLKLLNPARLKIWCFKEPSLFLEGYLLSEGLILENFNFEASWVFYLSRCHQWVNQ